MKKVISTKVDGAKYAEFLEYCAKNDKYPANALRDALDLLLDEDRHELRVISEEPSKHVKPKETPKPKSVKDEKEIEKPNTQEDEDELDLF